MILLIQIVVKWHNVSDRQSNVIFFFECLKAIVICWCCTFKWADHQRSCKGADVTLWCFLILSCFTGTVICLLGLWRQGLQHWRDQSSQYKTSEYLWLKKSCPAISLSLFSKTREMSLLTRESMNKPGNNMWQLRHSQSFCGLEIKRKSNDAVLAGSDVLLETQH